MTWTDIVTSALVLINEMGAGDTPNPDEIFDGGDRFNTLLAAWNIIELHLFVVTNFQHALVGGQGAYVMGAGGADFNTARPVKIESAGAILNGIRTPIELINSQK
jgi:hypothetical protein